MPPKVNKIEAEIKRLSKLEGNKTCADCPEKVPGYVDLTHNVFICTKCSGIHREFQFKVKGVSMTVFSAEDVEGLAAMGNEAFNGLYLANLNPRDYIIPNGSDMTKLKEFIRMKYIDKRWHRDGRGGGGGGGGAYSDSHFASSAPSAPQPQPQTDSNRISMKFNTGTKAAPPSRRASTGSVEIKKPAAATDNLAGDLDLLSMSDNTNNSHQSSFDPFGGPPPAQNKANGANNTASHDPFGSSDGFGTTSHSHSHDPFGSSTTGGFDAFGGPAAAKAVDPFDPFASPSPTPTGVKPVTNAAPNQPSGGFDPFGGAPHQTAHNSFDAFGSPPPQQSLAPMPFIKVNPPAAPAPAPAPATNTNTNAAKKDFGAFDDLLTPANAAPDVNHHSNNPFDNPFSAPPAGPGGPGARPGPAGAAAPYPPHQHPAGPYGAAPGNPYNYPPQQPNPGYGGYGGPVPGNYPPPPYGYPNAAYPPQYPPAGYPGGPVPGYGAPPGAPPNAHYGGVPQPAVAPIQAVPQAPPAAPAAPDPFAAMSNLAWNAVGGSAPSASSTQSKPQSFSPAPNTFQPASPAPAPALNNNAPPPPQQSVNPFDLF